jgi:hypothetical protein
MAIGGITFFVFDLLLPSSSFPLWFLLLLIALFFPNLGVLHLSLNGEGSPSGIYVFRNSLRATPTAYV